MQPSIQYLSLHDWLIQLMSSRLIQQHTPEFTCFSLIPPLMGIKVVSPLGYCTLCEHRYPNPIFSCCPCFQNH